MAAELYDEEFVRDLKTGDMMFKQIRSRDDRRIAKKWMARVCKLRSPDVKVKQNRNEFYKYLLSLMKATIDNQKEIDEVKGGKFYLSGIQFKDICEEDEGVCILGKGALRSKIMLDGMILEQKPVISFKSTWSPDRRTYVAIQPLPNRGAMIYMACNARPELGWDTKESRRKAT